MKSTQRKLMDIMAQSGFEVKSRGICLGVSCVALQSMLNDRLAYFDTMTQRAYASVENDVPEKNLFHFFELINGYQALGKAGIRTKLVPGKTQMGKMVCFFSTATSINHPYLRKNLIEVACFRKQCEFNDFENLFSSYEELCAHSNQVPSIGFLLTARNHAVTVSYDHHSGIWKFVNANCLSKEFSHKTFDGYEALTNALMTAFYGTTFTGDNRKLTVRVFSTKDDMLLASGFINDWEVRLDRLTMTLGLPGGRDNIRHG